MNPEPLYNLTIDPDTNNERRYPKVSRDEFQIAADYEMRDDTDRDLLNDLTRAVVGIREFAITVRGNVHQAKGYSMELIPPVIPGQLSLDPIMPKEGSVKASVLHLLQAHPDGMCRRDFANEDIYEVSNRIGELEADGWTIIKGRCEWHNHRQRFTLYSL